MKTLPLSLILAGGLFSILHLTLLSQLQQPNLFYLHFLALAGLINLIGQKKEFISLGSQLFSSCLGLSLLALILLRSQMPLGYNPHLSLLGRFFSLVCLTSGIKQLNFYRAEFLVAIYLFLYPLFSRLLLTLNLPYLTAKASVFLLNIFQLSASQQDTLVILPTGRVEVYGGCSGIELLILLLFVGVLFLLNFPTRLSQACLEIIF